jgi:dihydrofolate synthase/folylpolyglutamate synthase
MPSAADWVASLSPWPEEFGLGRMRMLLDALDEPQRQFPSVHVVGTNGKSTATRTIEAYLEAAGLEVGAYLSPHVRGWSERIRVGGEEADFPGAIERVRAAAIAVGATQFEVLTAAAFAEFAAADVDAAVVEAGLGGRHDATNVIAAPVVLLTNVALDHTDVLGGTREAIAREKLAVVTHDAIAVLPDAEFRALVPATAQVVYGGAREAAGAFLGTALEGEVSVELPGRLERRSDTEVWDGGHNPEGLDWALPQLPPGRYTVVASILKDKDVEAMLERLARAGDRLIATASSNPRALPAEELAERARPWFAEVETLPDPEEAVVRARLSPPVLVTGSLYLLSDLAGREEQRVE